MRTSYRHRLRRFLVATVNLSLVRPGTWSVDWLHVPPAARGSGLGRRLMEGVLADADREGVRLTLEVRACAGKATGPDQRALELWYRKLGFRATGRRGTFGPVFTRAPRRARRRSA